MKNVEPITEEEIQDIKHKVSRNRIIKEIALYATSILVVVVMLATTIMTLKWNFLWLVLGCFAINLVINLITGRNAN